VFQDKAGRAACTAAPARACYCKPPSNPRPPWRRCAATASCAVATPGPAPARMG